MFISVIIFFFLGYFGGLAIGDTQDDANYDIYWSSLSNDEKSKVKSNAFLKLKLALTISFAVIIVACILKNVILVLIVVCLSMLFSGLYIGYKKGLRLDDNE